MKSQQDQPTHDDSRAAHRVARSNASVNGYRTPWARVIAASVATIGSFGVVLSGMWAINVALN